MSFYFSNSNVATAPTLTFNNVTEFVCKPRFNNVVQLRRYTIEFLCDLCTFNFNAFIMRLCNFLLQISLNYIRYVFYRITSFYLILLLYNLFELFLSIAKYF